MKEYKGKPEWLHYREFLSTEKQTNKNNKNITNRSIQEL